MAYATMAKHAIHVRMIVGNAGVHPIRPQVPRVPTTDTQPTVNVAMAPTIPYKRPRSLPRAIPLPGPGLLVVIVPYVSAIHPV